MSETPIGDDVMGPVEGDPTEVTGVDDSELLEPGLVRGIAPHGVNEAFRIGGEDDPDDPDAELATEGDELAEPTDNSGEPEGGDEPQEANAVQDNGNELDGDEPDATV